MIALCAFLFCAAPEANPVVAPPFVIVAPWFAGAAPSLGRLQRGRLQWADASGFAGECVTTAIEGGAA